MALIPSERLAALKAELARAIERVFERHGATFVGVGRHRRTRTCPLRAEPHAGADVNVNVETGLWDCHACGRGGDPLHAVAGFLGLDSERDFVAVARAASELVGVELADSEDPAEAERQRATLRAAQLERAAEAERAAARREAEAAEAVAKAQRVWPLFAVEDPRGVAYLASRGLAAAELGEVVRYTRDGDPAVALYDEAGVLVSITWRRLEGEPKTRVLAGCTNKGTAVGRVSELEAGGRAVVVEGVIDALTAGLHWRGPGTVVLGAPGAESYPGVVASVARRLVAVGGGRLVLVLDGDRAGLEAGRRSVAAVEAAGLDPALVEVALLGHHDLNDAHRAGWTAAAPPAADDPRLEIALLLQAAAERASLDAIAAREDEPWLPAGFTVVDAPASLGAARRRRGRTVYLAEPGSVRPQDRITLRSREPLRLAEEFRDRHPHLVYWAGEFWRLEPGQHAAFGRVPTDVLTGLVYSFLDRVRLERTDDEGNVELVPLGAKRSTVAELLAALPSRVRRIHADPPCSLEAGASFEPADVVVCPNGLLHLPTRELRPASPDLFVTTGIDVDFERAAPLPETWLRFLGEIFEGDQESIDTLQEWIGYVLTPDASLQKMLAVIGPPRSGKSTIAKLIAALLGPKNVVPATLSDLERPFALAAWVDKQLAVFADARLSGRTDQAPIAERLLSITGEDAQTIDRKHKEPISVRLRTRIMLISNEPPRLSDASTALASRFVVLATRRSFLGEEDLDLERRLLEELPGIFAWAIDGWARLRARRRLLQPESGRELVSEIESLSSPVKTFADDCLEFDPSYDEACQVVYDRWRKWCEDQGMREPGPANVFGRNLRAALPGLPPIDQRRVPTTGERRRWWMGLRVRSVASNVVALPGSSTWRDRG